MSVRWDKQRKRFIVDYYPQGRVGKRIRLTLPKSVTDREIADSIERDLRNPIENSEVAVITGGVVSDLFPLYIKYCAMHLADRTHDDVKMAWDLYIKNILGNYRVEEIGKEHTTIYKRIRKEEYVRKPASNRTINKEMYYFMGFLKWCRTEHKINIKDFRYKPLEQKKKIPLVLALSEAVKILRNSDPFHKVFMLWLYILGLRFSELSNVCIEDIDKANNTVVIRETKGGDPRLLPVSRPLVKAALKLAGKRKTGYLFQSRVSGGRVRDIRCAIKNACKAAKIEKKVTPHLMRHTMATHLMDMRINIKIIQVILGHARESTTAEMYTHANVSHMRTAQNALEQQLNKAMRIK
jgi:integrase